MKKVKSLLIISLFVIFGSLVGAASTQAFIYGMDVPSSNWIGSLTWSDNTTGPIYATDGWANIATSLTWSIVGDGPYLRYTYIWNTPTRNLSHIIIEVSEGAKIIGSGYEGPDNYSGPSNPGIPLGGIYGIKFDADNTNFTLSFLSDRMPVWGNFYAKDGYYKDGEIDVYAYNTGWVGGTGFYAAVPDSEIYTVPNVPIPAAAWLLGSGLIGLVVIRRRMKK